MNELPEEPSTEEAFKNAAAKRCLFGANESNGILKSEYVDPNSGLKTSKLVALTRRCTLPDACKLWVEGLYEVQRGYNLSEFGVDDKQEDRPICSAGTFNKLLEKLQGVHPDVEIIYITKERATIKLQIVVRETAKLYLSTLSSSGLDEVLKKIEADGV